MQSGSTKTFRFFFLSSLLGFLIGCCVIVTFKAGFDIVWTAVIPLSLQCGAGSPGSYLKAEELVKDVPRLAIAKALLEDGPTGGVIGAVLAFAIASSLGRKPAKHHESST